MKTKFLTTIFIFLLTLVSYKAFSSAESEVATEVGVGAVAGGVASTAVKGTLGESLKGVGQWLNTPPGIATLSGISLGMNTILYNAASEQEIESKANAEKIQKLIDVYKANFADYCPNGRENLAEPKCYCYLETGKKNTNRSNSETCQKLWAKDDIKLDGTKDNYLKPKLASELYGCMTVNKVFDENCRCKKLVNASGENACLKADQLSISVPSSMAGFAKASGVQEMLGVGVNTANGNGDLGKFNAASLAVNAARSRNAALELLEANQNKLKGGNDILRIFKNPDDAITASQRILGEDNIRNHNNGESILGSSTAPEGKLAESVKAVEADLKKNGVELSGGAGVNKAKNKKDGGFKFAFNEASSQGGQVLNLPDSGEETKKYKITGDINKNSDSSIFDILSNRYMQSGLKRLIEEE